MKRYIALLLCLLCLCGCGGETVTESGVAATTAPVAQLACAIAEGTDVRITGIISDSVSCLHDYSLTVRQMQTLEQSELLLISGAGLEDFMEDVLPEEKTVDCSQGIALLQQAHGEHSHPDPHIWLDPDNAAMMAQNICRALSQTYPDHAEAFQANTDALLVDLAQLKAWGQSELSELTTNKIITFHDGFAYLAKAFGLEILASVEEESGSEASAADLTEIIDLVREFKLPCVFTERNGSDAAASVISAETGVKVCALDTVMGGSDYFEAMKANITTLKEALQ